MPVMMMDVGLFERRRDSTAGVSMEKRVLSNVPRKRSPRDARSIAGSVGPSAEREGCFELLDLGIGGTVRYLWHFVLWLALRIGRASELVRLNQRRGQDDSLLWQSSLAC